MNPNGRTGPAWTAEEDAILRSLYPNSDWVVISAALPRRSQQAIRARANSFDMKRDGREQWKTHEIRILREIYETTMPIREIVARLAPHTMISVHKRAAELGLKRPRLGLVHHHPGWERLRSLLESRGPMSQVEIAEALGIGESAVSKMRETYGKHLRIAGYLPPPHKGKWKPLIGIADGRADAPRPFKRRLDGIPKITMADVPVRRIEKCWDSMEEAA
jgi:hypothetical protein